MIDYNVIIDFPIPEILKNEIEETEKAYEEMGELGYMDYVEHVDTLCKNYYKDGKLTKAQWDKILSRFPEDPNYL